jgi:L-iditol 2-dehydrogenase
MLGIAKTAPGPGNVALVERPEPVVRPGHVILDVVGAGICGTDLHIWDDEFPSEPPVTMGHEVSGLVREVGEGVDGWAPGDRVVSETYFSTCGECEWCRGGRPNLCAGRRSIGSREDGAFAPRVLVPARGLHRIPDRLDGHAASLSEPLACVCNCLLDPRTVKEGDRVLVVGPGPVGLLAAQVARALGGDVHVRGAPRDGARLAKARELGFEASQAGAADDPAPAGFGVVIECSGSAGGIAFALEAAARRARFVQVGLAGKPVAIPFDEICYRELTVTSGNAHTPRSWRRALELIESRAVELEPLVSEVVPLAEWERAFAATREGSGIKFVIAPSI